MEIDETVPNTTIITNDSIDLSKESSQTIDLSKDLPETSDSLTPKEDSNELKSNETEKELKNEDKTITKEAETVSKNEDKTVAKETEKESKSEDKTITKEPEIVDLLDDDDDDEGDSMVKEVATKTPCEVIDLVCKGKQGGNSRCINYACKSGVLMTTAPVFCLSYYRVHNSEGKLREVCEECYNAALVHYDNLATALMDGKLLFDQDLPVRDDLVEIDDSDSDEEAETEIAEYFDDENMKFIEENFDKILLETMDKFHLKKHMDDSVSLLKTKAKKVTASCNEVDDMVKDVRKNLDRIQKDLYGLFKCRYENLPPIEIIDMDLGKPSVVTESPMLKKNFEVERRSRRNIKPVSYAELDDPGSSNSPAVEGKEPEPEMVEPPPNLPEKGTIVKPPLQIGEFYYAIRFLSMGAWVKVKLFSIVKPGNLVNGQVVNQNMYGITMESNNKVPVNRLVSGKEIAYATAANVQLEVGARVIAAFKEGSSATDARKLKKEQFYPGIVAEPLSATNRYRYLIFFDDGYAQYVHYNLVYLILDSSEEVWKDMHIDSRSFIKKYLESYPDRAMVKLRKDQTLRTEYNGKWWTSTVTNIDCSLAQIFFNSSNRIEWIYRGSTRLKPMFKEEQAASNRLQNKSRVPRQASDMVNQPYVQYSRNEGEGDQGDKAPVRSVAKKSTTKPAFSNQRNQNSNVTVPFLPSVEPASPPSSPVPSHQAPPPSKVVYFTPRSQSNTRTPYNPHVCSPNCKKFIIYNVTKLNGYNPLSKPLLCGWNRVTYKQRGKKTINYKAPCGRFIRDMAELHMYLQLTESEMTVDLFNFDFWVHCLAEFVLEKNVTVLKDLSNGLEQVPIPVVNYVDDKALNFSDYSIQREPMEGVHLNLDPEFLCGCDCEDDCQDKTKCACWKLTLQALKFYPKDTSPDEIGYVYRRLPEAVHTGIYECNSKCKCKKTCLNRVVQNPLQLKLQLFKTYNKGWGIRCLNDIPQGTFICIYAGSMLTEQMANEGGKNYGDEYLAELDYIEVVEKMKEDYEEEAYEESEDREEKENKKQSSEEEDEEEDEPLSVLRTRKKNAYECEDEDYTADVVVQKGISSIRTRLRGRTDTDKSKSEEEASENDAKKQKTADDDTVMISDDDEDMREPSSFNPKTEKDDDSISSRCFSVRKIFGKDESVYIMDAKVKGNIGRFLNHSCSPNVFVQNVFVDTHDLRFPWVAFFALTFIRAGTELTWNYNYDVGSVPGKVMYCHCASSECRGRLL